MAHKQGTVEAARELDTSVCRSDEDSDSSKRQAGHEGFEEARVHKAEVDGVPHALGFADPPRELGARENKEDNGKDLEAETSQHDVFADVALIPGISSGSDGAASGLQDQGDDVAGAEDDCVSAWFETGELRTVDDDDAREAEVDGCG